MPERPANERVSWKYGRWPAHETARRINDRIGRDPRVIGRWVIAAVVARWGRRRVKACRSRGDRWWRVRRELLRMKLTLETFNPVEQHLFITQRLALVSGFFLRGALRLLHHELKIPQFSWIGGTDIRKNRVPLLVAPLVEVTPRRCRSERQQRQQRKQSTPAEKSRTSVVGFRHNLQTPARAVPEQGRRCIRACVLAGGGTRPFSHNVHRRRAAMDWRMCSAIRERRRVPPARER